MKCGFLPVSQESVLVGEVSYHDYYGILIDPEERQLIARNLGPVNKVSLAGHLTFFLFFLLPNRPPRHLAAGDGPEIKSGPRFIACP